VNDAELRQRLSELEATREEIRAEMDDLLQELASTEEDSFAMRFAQRMMDERDDARRRIAELESVLTSIDTSAEAKRQAILADAVLMRRVISNIINQPLMARDQVQSHLILVHEKVRGRSYE
jgi:predicted nuclease with TOPRIM domain